MCGGWHGYGAVFGALSVEGGDGDLRCDDIGFQREMQVFGYDDWGEQHESEEDTRDFEMGMQDGGVGDIATDDDNIDDTDDDVDDIDGERVIGLVMISKWCHSWCLESMNKSRTDFHSNDSTFIIVNMKVP